MCGRAHDQRGPQTRAAVIDANTGCTRERCDCRRIDESLTKLKSYVVVESTKAGAPTVGSFDRRARIGRSVWGVECRLRRESMAAPGRKTLHEQYAERIPQFAHCIDTARASAAMIACGPRPDLGDYARLVRRAIKPFSRHVAFCPETMIHRDGNRAGPMRYQAFGEASPSGLQMTTK